MIPPKWKSITVACTHVMGLFIGSEWEKNISVLEPSTGLTSKDGYGGVNSTPVT